MKLSLIFLFAFATASSLIRVNDKNFKDVVLLSGNFTLVDFYADWCRHCMKLMPTIEQLAELYADVPNVQIAKINGDADGRKMTRKYKIPGFPSLLMFHGEDEPVEFEGMRDLDSISNFVQQVSGVRLGSSDEEESSEYEGPSKIVEVNDESFQQDVLQASHKTVVAFTAPWCQFCQKFKPVLAKLANQIYAEDGETIKFAEVNLAEENKAHVSKIVGQFGVSLLPTILLFDPSKTDDDGLRRPMPYTGERSLGAMVDYVNDIAGLYRNESGNLTHQAGRIEKLDEAIRSISEDSKDAVLDEIESLKESLVQFGKDGLVQAEDVWLRDDVSMLSYYSKLAVKVASGDGAYVLKELARLERIITKNARDLERSARDYMQKRINILKAYLDQ
ncbi:thioredoxin-like protein [Metschnikowia bicuspidata var. bicuspidata NRRL YB-4993]|uniref:protein disulfide-isomerase n=1 Tax=Metschnikowia bicuspidata var. bicuspidata NRRL YB-4993 TaxID=869754 RepID=A0A1A0HHL9_9ASCO|nr:thioredoxin-like protein [Metschnikowia bicuspidata var. bicuspidata NRRL YB-4993]OBA23501.1 thioredoxin-like protein [Metschnikowia bicuspidata var. bicuspidata NRRL YB-4993]